MYRFTDQSNEGRLLRKTCMFLVNKAISKLKTGNKLALLQVYPSLSVQLSL